MPRLFTGLEIPAPARESLTRLRTPLPGAKWVEAEDFHVTLRFAGDIDSRTAKDFADALEAIDAPAFEMRLEGMGAFGGRDPRALWVGVVAGPELNALARANERAARAAGLPPCGRAFKPHVTLARLRHASATEVARVLERGAGYRSLPIVADRFVLFSSKPGSGGGPYVVEAEFPLRGVVDADS